MLIDVSFSEQKQMISPALTLVVKKSPSSCLLRTYIRCVVMCLRLWLRLWWLIVR